VPFYICRIDAPRNAPKRGHRPVTTTAADIRRARPPPPETSSQEDAAIFSAFTISATVWLLIMTAVGLLLSFKFTYPDLATNPYLSFGRLRPIHTNGTFYGWASLALVGLAFYVAACSSAVGLQQKRLAWAALWSYNIAAVLGSITLDLGISNSSQEYREWVWWSGVLSARRRAERARRRCDGNGSARSRDIHCELVIHRRTGAVER
jgi:cytochrome c oxidase cbb3-type subunit 1